MDLIPADGIPVINDDSEPVPAFGIVAYSGTGVNADGFVSITKPTLDGQLTVLVNGSVVIPAGEQGICYPIRQGAIAAYIPDEQTGADPAANEIWGVAAGSWYLVREQPGFQILGGASNGWVAIAPMQANWVQWVKLTSTSLDATSGCYPATRYTRDVAAQTWTSVGSVWFYDPVTPTNATTSMYIESVYQGFFDGLEVWGATTWSGSGGGGSITYSKTGGSTITGVTTINIDPSGSPMTLSGSTPTATIGINAAALATAGYVTATGQTISGLKFFPDGVDVSGSGGLSGQSIHGSSSAGFTLTAIGTTSGGLRLVGADTGANSSTIDFFGQYVDITTTAFKIDSQTGISTYSVSANDINYHKGIFTGSPGATANMVGAMVFLDTGASSSLVRFGYIDPPTGTGQVFTSNGVGSYPSWQTPSGGTGTVTSVSVVTANGVSGSVATATTTPAITLTLGAITPSSVNSLTITTSTGTLTIANLKTFTVNNTLTLSGTDGSTLNVGGGGTLGTAAYTASTAYVSSTLMTTLGDIIYEDATPTPARLAGNTTTTKKFLTQTGTGTVSAVPGWNTIVGGDLPSSGVSAATYYLANPTFDATGRATSAQNASVIVLRDEKSSSTDGGSATSGAWRTRTLNTEAADTNSNCTLASNQFTLTAGTYAIWASAPAFNTNRHAIRLQNVTDGTTICSGSSEYASSLQTRSTIEGYVFTIGASKALEIQHQVQTTSNTNGFGVAAGGFFTVANEVYTQVTLIRIG